MATPPLPHLPKHSTSRLQSSQASSVHSLRLLPFTLLPLLRRAFLPPQIIPLRRHMLQCSLVHPLLSRWPPSALAVLQAMVVTSFPFHDSLPLLHPAVSLLWPLLLLLLPRRVPRKVTVNRRPRKQWVFRMCQVNLLIDLKKLSYYINCVPFVYFSAFYTLIFNNFHQVLSNIHAKWLATSTLLISH